jgi:hypothetical protein
MSAYCSPRVQPEQDDSMPLAPERFFDPTLPLVVRRFFVAAGRHFNPGDTFDWKRLAVNQRRTRQLFEAGKLMHGPAAAPLPRAAVEKRAEIVLPDAAPFIAVEMQDEDAHHVAIMAAALADEPPAATAEDDGLDVLDMKALREIADVENAPFRVSREAQRQAIRENRRNTGA